MMKKILDYIKNHIFISQFLFCIAGSLVLGVFWGTYNSLKEAIKYSQSAGELLITFFASIMVMIIVFSSLVYPLIVTVYEIIYLFCTIIKDKEYDNKIILYLTSIFGNINKKAAALYDLFLVLFGAVIEFILLFTVHEIIIDAQWYEELHNQQLHTPISNEGAVTFFVLLTMFVVGVFILTIIPSNKRPPLTTVLSISFMYIGVIEAVLFTIQIAGMNLKDLNGNVNYKFTLDLLYTFVVPFNMILILIRMMIIEIRSFEISGSHMSKINSIPFLRLCSKTLNNSKNWPIIALIMMIPVLVCIIAILMLFGQAPDDAIKAFTETANYTFSQRIPPQNVYYDEHYLCTVAAGGHRRIVKPVRMGKRHGHDVVVNRQLLIANAFEQILEEKTPDFHHKVRAFYDKYGFPISKHIKTKSAADVIWFLMKPLEWIFLITIYMVDIKPEDRIHSQYL